MNISHYGEKSERASKKRAWCKNCRVNRLPGILGEIESKSPRNGTYKVRVGRVNGSRSYYAHSFGERRSGGIVSELIVEVENQIIYHQKKLEELAISLRRLNSIKEHSK